MVSKKTVFLVLTVLSLFVPLLLFKDLNLNLDLNEDISNVTWDEAVKILKSGEVNTVAQEHSLNVFIVLNNGTIVQTKEPQIDAIFDEIRKCGDPCKNVATASE